MNKLLIPFLIFDILNFQDVMEIDKAVFPVLDSINVVSIEQNLEYGGYVYYCDENTTEVFSLHTTPPMTDSLAHQVTIYPDKHLERRGCKRIASYHTHGDYQPKFEYKDENFSDTDTTGQKIVTYLATPFGRILKYIPWEGKVYEYNRVFRVWKEYYGIRDNKDASNTHPYLENFPKELNKTIEGKKKRT